MSQNAPIGTDGTAIQPELFSHGPSRTRHELEELFNRRRRVRVRITLTRNRVSMLSVEFKSIALIRVRMHERFLDAPPDVIEALDLYLRKRDRAAWRVVVRHAQTIVPAAPAARRTRLRKKGRHYDLGVLYDEVNGEYFSDSLRCRIGWGSRPRAMGRGRRRSIRYGSFRDEDQSIRIHPSLDDACVPPEFIRYIVYHEMLHAVVPSEERNGRHLHHPPAFRRLEARYPDIARMRRLCKELIPVLA